MINGVTHAHLGPIWYQKELSNVPYSSNQFLSWDFFAVSQSQPALIVPNAYNKNQDIDLKPKFETVTGEDMDTDIELE